MVIGTVSQIEVDQGLIGDAFCVGQRLEVVDGAAVDVDGDLLFQPVRVRIFSWIQLTDVIFISHTITSNSIKINTLLGFGCLPCRDNYADRYNFFARNRNYAGLCNGVPAGMRGLLHPIFNDQVRHTLKLSDIICDQNHIFRYGVRGDQHI